MVSKEDMALRNTFKKTYLEVSRTKLAYTLQDGSLAEFLATVEQEQLDGSWSSSVSFLR